MRGAFAFPNKSRDVGGSSLSIFSSCSLFAVIHMYISIDEMKSGVCRGLKIAGSTTRIFKNKIQTVSVDSRH